VVSSDFEAFRGDEEENVVMLAEDLDVGFIASRNGINEALMLEIEAVAVKGGRCGIVQHRLVRNPDTEDISQNGSGFAGRDGEGYIECEDKSEDVLGVMDPRQINGWFIRGCVVKLIRFEVVLPVLIVELEL